MKLWNAFTSEVDNLAAKTHLCLLKMRCILQNRLYTSQNQTLTFLHRISDY